MLVIDNRGAVFDSVVVFGDSSLFICTKSDKEIDETLSRLRDAGCDAEVGEILKDGVSVEFSGISKVKCNVTSEMISIDYKDSKKKKTNQTLSCQDEATVSEVMAALKQRLPAFEEKQEQYGVFRSAIKPAVFVSISVLLTGVLVIMANTLVNASGVDIDGRKALLKRVISGVLEFLGPVGVGVVGAVVTLGFVLWLAKRVKNPPLMRTLSQA
ncbi:hypothetical protein [Arhodomonas sp. AD133]|uniref:hypothetical protein n=1 Tax=Arhodomonas sp. AD133 TaxID=3415009 RepID=UPI003EBDBB51